MDGMLVFSIELLLLMDEVHDAALLFVVFLLGLIIAVHLVDTFEGVQDNPVDAWPSEHVFHLS